VQIKLTSTCPQVIKSKSTVGKPQKHNFFLTRYRPAMPFGNRKKNILEDLLISVLSQFQNITPLET